MDDMQFDNDASVCLFCGTKQRSVYNMILHLIDNHLEYDEAELRLKCPVCKFKLNKVDRVQSADYSVAMFRNHIVTRKFPGIQSKPVTFEEIRDHLWTEYHKQALGVKP